jgi:hypothetical protein
MTENKAEKSPQELEEKAIAVRTSIAANGRGLMLRNLDDMFRFGQFVQKCRLANSAEEALIKIQTGAELNIPPMKALQSVLVVNGQARLWGDMPLGLVRRSGLLESITETIEGEICKDLKTTKDDVKAVCTTKRKGEDAKTTEFSVADAKRAGLWGKTGTWLTHPQRMLKYKARSFNLRDNYPDVLAGITIHEEFEGVDLLDTQTNDKPRSAALLENEKLSTMPAVEKPPVTVPPEVAVKPTQATEGKMTPAEATEHAEDVLTDKVYTCTGKMESECPEKDRRLKIDDDHLEQDESGGYLCPGCGYLLEEIKE